MLQIERAEVISREISKTYTYGKEQILTLSIRYPELRPALNTLTYISRQYRHKAQLYYNDVSSRLYASAVQELKDTRAGGYPFRPYDAVMDYQLTLNEGCHFSTYTDRYEFTGGAHGDTKRSSDSWNLQTGKRVRLQDLFPRGENVRRTVIEQLLREAKKQQSEESVFFDDYKSLIVKYFNPESFFLTPDGVAFYYQQTEIGPYAIGLPVFELSYYKLEIEPPGCMRPSIR